MSRSCFNCEDTYSVVWSDKYNEFFCEDCLEYSMGDKNGKD